jgi:hypothetical protein
MAPGKDACYASTVGDIILANPLRVVPDKHTDGKWFGPAASQFGDCSARALLEDIIRQNPDQAGELQGVYRKYFETLPDVAS